MRPAARLLLAALTAGALSCSPDSGLPTTFGVNLFVQLGPGVKAQTTQLTLNITGAETFGKTFDLSAFDGDELRAHYVPGATGGTLTFEAIALAQGGGKVAEDKGDVTLIAGQAVPLTLTLNIGGGGDGGMTCIPPCGVGTYCSATGTCLPQKTAGQPCGAQVECQPGFTCLDGVCCNQPVCGPCRNCGSDGMCSVVVSSRPDTSTTGCMGTSTCDSSGECKRVLGQACGDSSQCADATCLDGVCCSVSACPECMNCGPSGMCDVRVGTTDGADDGTGTMCAGDRACDAAGMCKARWMLVGTDLNKDTGGFELFTVGLGNQIFYANGSNTGASQFFRSFNVTNNAFADQGLTGNDLVFAGFGGTLVVAAGRLHFIANAARSYLPNQTPLASWVDYATYPTRRGEAGYTVVGNVIYVMGGRDINNVNQKTVQTFNAASGTWGTIADTPDALYRSCAGAINGRVYVMGGQTPQKKAYYFDTASPAAGWQALPDIPHNCSETPGLAWRNKLVFGTFNGIQVYNPATNTWEAPIPFPTVMSARWSIAVAGPANDLFAVTGSGTSVVIYKFVFN